jgi:hypothetical protein
MRTVATAIESYIVDWNSILGTRDMQDALEPPRLEGWDARLMAYTRMTTPVAYITSIPRDPFQEGYHDTDTRTQKEFNFQAGNTYSTGNAARMRRRGYTWFVNSIGPALSRSGPTVFQCLRGNNIEAICIIYDPTNGSVSEGQIIRTNKGIYDHPDTSPRVD